MFQTGQEVKESGVYRVNHAEHRLPHEVMLIAGQQFPRCGRCAAKVRFELVKSAPYLAARSNIIVQTLSARRSETRDDGQAAA